MLLMWQRLLKFICCLVSGLLYGLLLKLVEWGFPIIISPPSLCSMFACVWSSLHFLLMQYTSTRITREWREKCCCLYPFYNPIPPCKWDNVWTHYHPHRIIILTWVRQYKNVSEWVNMMMIWMKGREEKNIYGKNPRGGYH